ncbi:TPA: hypothetical protein ACN360_002317 [Vibrio parahaemolyticus]
MRIYHYDRYYKFYLYFEDRDDVDDDNAKHGYGIPASSTIKEPPLEKCSSDEVAIFENEEWKIVKNNFFKPKFKEYNYDSGRGLDTFQYINPDFFDFMKYPSMPQFCNANLVGMRIYQSIIIINKKFYQCVDMYRLILENNDGCIDCSIGQQSEILSPSILYEFKTEMESIIFIMRRVLDSLVQLTDLMVNFTSFEKAKKLENDSIGSLFSNKPKNMEVKGIILGNEVYEKDTTKFLETSNNLFNGFKHSLMHDESFRIIGIDYPTFVGFLVKHTDHKREIQYHNHNAYHIMMGFQDCIERILRNQERYRKTVSSRV